MSQSHPCMTLALAGLSVAVGAEEPQTMAPVVVTADKLLTEYVQNHPQDVKQVSRAEIIQRNLPNVEEVLKTMPGVDVQPSPGTGSRVSIRGSGKTGGVLILLNGRPLNSNLYGNQDLSAIPVDIIDSVTVFKPPVPVWLGPGGSDGVINIVTRERTAEKKGQTKTNVKLGGGSYGQAEGSISHALQAAGGSLLLTANGNHRDGKRQNSDRTDGSLGAFWSRSQPGSAKYEVNTRYFDSEAGSSGPADNLTPEARQRYSKGSLDTRVSGLLGDKGTYAMNLYGDATTLKDRSQEGPTYTLNDRKVGLKSEVALTEAQGAWEMRISGLLEGDAMDHTLAGEHGRSTAMLGSQYDRRMGKWTASLGLKGTQITGFGFNPGMTVGLGLGLTDHLLLRGRSGYTVNAPTFEQLYQSSHGSVDQTRGNPNLREEKIWSHELGFEYRQAKTFFFQFSLFRTDTRDLISAMRGADLIYRPVNLDKAMRQGVEMSWKEAWESGWQGEMNLILQDSKNSDTGADLPYTPKIKAKTTAQYSLKAAKTRLEASLRYEGARFTSRENLPAQNLHGYTCMDLSLTQPFTFRGLSLDWYLRVNNLFNTSFESHQGYPDDGFRLNSGLQARW
ncbi:MAG: TonB-dependent receptor plug [Holophagaceae bacterium]|nr:TonB-dependent receptor plug [Holophagaceae bacterium]